MKEESPCLPIELWQQILGYLHVREVWAMRSVSCVFLEVARDLRYRTMTLGIFEFDVQNGYAKRFRRLGELPFAPCIRHLSFVPFDLLRGNVYEDRPIAETIQEKRRIASETISKFTNVTQVQVSYPAHYPTAPLKQVVPLIVHALKCSTAHLTALAIESHVELLEILLTSFTFPCLEDFKMGEIMVRDDNHHFISSTVAFLNTHRQTLRSLSLRSAGPAIFNISRLLKGVEQMPNLTFFSVSPESASPDILRKFMETHRKTIESLFIFVPGSKAGKLPRPLMSLASAIPSLRNLTIQVAVEQLNHANILPDTQDILDFVQFHGTNSNCLRSFVMKNRIIVPEQWLKAPIPWSRLIKLHVEIPLVTFKIMDAVGADFTELVELSLVETYTEVRRHDLPPNPATFQKFHEAIKNRRYSSSPLRHFDVVHTETMHEAWWVDVMKAFPALLAINDRGRAEVARSTLWESVSNFL